MNKLCHYIKAILITIAVPCLIYSQPFPDLKFFPVHANTPWPTKKINSIFTDQRGLVWFTTESAGLLRYDGNAIKQCISPDSISSTLHEMSVDRNNVLYISAGEGLIRFNTATGQMKRYLHDNKDNYSVSKDDKPNPFVDSRNRVWVTGTGLQKLDVNTGKFISFQTPPLPTNLPLGEYNQFENMVEDSAGNIWIASAYGLYKADTVHRKLIPYYHGKYSWVTGILIDKNQQFWISTWGKGIMKFNPMSGEYITLNTPEIKWGITYSICSYEDINHKKWICFTGLESLILLDPVTEKCKLFFIGSNVNIVHSDKSNRLWLVADNNIYTVDNVQQQITVYPLSQQLHLSENDFGHPHFWFERGNEIWLSLYFGKGIIRFSKELKFISKQLTFPPSSNSDFSKVINYIQEDDNHNIWYCTDSGLVKQSGKIYTVFIPKTTFNVETGTSFRDILQRPDGKWWIRSASKAVNLFDPLTGQFEKMYSPDSANTLTASKMDNQGRLWIGTDKGLFRFDENKDKFIPFPLHNPHLAGNKLLNYILDLLPDNNNKIWLATFAGIAVFDIDKQQFRYPEINETLSFIPSFRLLQDKQKNIWVIAAEKLIAFNPTTGQSKFFGSEIGLPSSFDAIGVFKQATDGNIWLAYTGGLCSFNPEKLLASNLSSGKIFVTDIYEDGKRLKTNDSILTINSNVSNIRINFAYTNYSIAEQNVLSFKLHENQKDVSWQKSNGEINFINLSPGTYTLELKGENRSLNTPSVIRNFILIISPKWYQTFLFKLSVFLLTSGLMYHAIRSRIMRIKSKALIKQKIAETEMAALKAQMNPHFMFNCINSIDAFIYSNDKDNATLYLNKFAKLLRNILDHSKENTVLLYKDIDTLKMYIELEELRHEGKFKTIFKIDEEILNNDFRVPPLIIQPFVENAILHGLKNKPGNDGLLTIDIQRKKDYIVYTISDNGIGREAAGTIAPNKISSYGMAMSFERIRLFNKEDEASVQITDNMENNMVSGTIVKVLLKPLYQYN